MKLKELVDYLTNGLSIEDRTSIKTSIAGALISQMAQANTYFDIKELELNKEEANSFFRGILDGLTALNHQHDNIISLLDEDEKELYSSNLEKQAKIKAILDFNLKALLEKEV
jgi:hypothetical protein